MSRKTLFVDWSNMMYRCLFVSIRQDPFDEDFKLWKHLVFRNLLDAIATHKPNEVIVAGDGRKPWRKNIFPGYKQSRTKARAESPVDYDKFFPVADEQWDTMKTVFSNMVWLKMDEIEADDIVGVLSEKLQNECIAVTTDKDYVQLLKNPNFRLFNPITGQETKSINPKMDLEVKIICGDKSDNIAGIMRGVGPKRAERLLTEGTLDKFLDDNPQSKELYVLNKRLIDMDNIPQNIRDTIIDAYEKSGTKPISAAVLNGFLMKNSPSLLNQPNALTPLSLSF